MEQSVIVLKAKTDKASLKTFAYQVAQITTQATKSNIQIVDCIVTFGGVKDVLREVKKLDGQKRFSSILIYSPSQICKNTLEYQDLVETLEKDFKVGVRCIRSM